MQNLLAQLIVQDSTLSPVVLDLFAKDSMLNPVVLDLQTQQNAQDLLAQKIVQDSKFKSSCTRRDWLKRIKCTSFRLSSVLLVIRFLKCFDSFLVNS